MNSNKSKTSLKTSKTESPYIHGLEVELDESDMPPPFSEKDHFDLKLETEGKSVPQTTIGKGVLNLIFGRHP